jgi:hypothetical protein
VGRCTPPGRGCRRTPAATTSPTGGAVATSASAPAPTSSTAPPGAGTSPGSRPTWRRSGERLGAAEARFEARALRLRTADGLDAAEARALGVDPGGAPAAELRDAGLLAPGPRLRLTERGMFLHGEVVARLAQD